MLWVVRCKMWIHVLIVCFLINLVMELMVSDGVVVE